MKVLFYILLLLSVFHSAHSFAQDEIYSVEINQAAVKMPNLMAYLYALKSDGFTVQFKGTETFTAFVGERPVQIKEILPPEKATDGIAYIFLIDISKSLKAEQFKDLKDNVMKWIETLKERDRAAIMTFGKEAKIIKAFTGNKDELKKALSDIQQTDNQTRLYGALKHAIQWSQSNVDNTVPLRRAIVILSDGINDFVGGETKEEVIRALSVNPVPIYALGYSKPPMDSKKEEGLKVLGEFAHVSGGRYVKVKLDTFKIFFDELRKRIDDVYTLIIDCSQCPTDGRVYHLQINLNTGQKVLTDSIDIRIMASQMPLQQEQTIPKKWYDQIPLWAYIVIALSVIVIIIAVVLIIRRNRKKSEEMRKALESARQKELAEAERAKQQKVLEPKPLTIMDVSGANKGIKVRFDKIGIYEREIKYKTSIANSIIVGRGDADINISGDEEISRQHCQIVFDKGNLFVIDLNSTNGTFLNGTPIKEPQKLNSGDIIMVGRTELRITFSNE